MGKDTLLRTDDRLRVALDVDATLALYHHILAADWGAMVGRQFTIDDITEWDTEQTKLGLPLKKLRELYNDIWNNKQDQILPTVDPRTLREFMGAFSVDLVTQRSQGTVAPLESWLAANFPGVVFTIDTTKTIEEKLGRGYDIHIDDSNPLADLFAAKAKGTEGKHLYLVTQPWNKDKGYDRYDNITVVNDLPDAIALIRKACSTERSVRRRNVT